MKTIIVCNYSDFIIIPEKKLIIEYFSGKIELKDILELKSRESDQKEYNPNYNIIDDSRNVEFLIRKNEIECYVDHLRNNKSFVRNRYVAYLTETPNQVVVATLFNVLKKELPINVKIVSTTIAALNWVGVSANQLKNIEFYLHILKNTNQKKT